MKVLLANSERGLRGGELQTVALAKGLLERGCEVAIAVRRDGALFSSASGTIRCEPFRFESPPLATPFAIAALFARWRPDILHAQTSAAHTHLWLAKKLVRGGPPLIVSRRVAFPVGRDLFSIFKYRTGVAHYVPISVAASRSLSSVGIPLSSMTIVPSGVDAAKFRNASGDHRVLEQWGVGRGAMLIGTVGAFEPEKGHGTLLGAAPLVLDKHPEVRFVLIGTGGSRPMLERLIAKSNLGGKILCVDQVAPLETILPLFHIFVLPSLNEGLSTAILAAMAAGLPIVASDVGGIPEAVTPECGVLVPPGNAEALADALLRLIGNAPLRERMGKGGRERAKSFDVSTMVARIYEIYRRIIAQGDEPPRQ